jgi:transcriptional regulator with XRE-family HTH domain
MHRLTQEEFADVLGCDVTTIWRLESNRSHSAKRIAQARATLTRRLNELGLTFVLETEIVADRLATRQ